MLTRPKLFMARITIVTMFLVALFPGSPALAAQATETSYTDEAYGVTVSWTDQWDATMPAPGAPFLYLSRDSSISIFVFIDDGQKVAPEDAVWSLASEDDEVLDDRSTETPAQLTLKLNDTGLVYNMESHSVNNGEATVTVAMGTIPVLQSSAVKIVNDDIRINGSPVLTGQPLDDAGADSGDATPETSTRTSRTTRGSDDTTDATSEATDRSDRISRDSRNSSETSDVTVEADPTDEAIPTDEADTRVSRTSRGTTETPEATEESATEITRTSRAGSGDAVTPEPTEEPTTEATVEPTEEVVVTDDPGSYTGTVWNYSFSYDTGMWEQSSTYDNPTVDGVRLDGESSTVAFMGLSDYGADPVACLMGEDDYYGAESESISNWEVATDANGHQLWYESDELAWGVFSYTFHSSSGTDVEFVDYISCETIPGEDAVLVVQMTSFPGDYNANLDAVLDILDTLEFQP